MSKRASEKAAKRSRADAQAAQPSRDYASIFREKAREREQQEPTIEREFAGVPVIVRRVHVQGWIRSGRVPDFLATVLIEASEGVREFTPESLSREEYKASLDFQRDLVCASLVRPVVVAEPRKLQEGEISYAEITESFPEMIEEILAWQAAGAPGIPVRVKGGEETSIGDLQTFREAERAADSTGESSGAARTES